MQISLAGRAAIITGGSKGLGLAIATQFAASGADVAIVARGRAALEEAVHTIRAGAHGRVAGVSADVAAAGDVERAYDEA
ncbi:MAG TPA: SDR family NAD(P)-dependent oxidoreductase, partial [Xanthobacteraceae bacterium]|nr:SDR family NAD(P)-dependent oxidoreductase [Xanthobacteraceae bacterium]